LKKILFITSQYRVGERVYPIIPYLAKKYQLDLLKVYQMKSNFLWPGDKDLRKIFKDTYQKYFTNVFEKVPNLDQYDLIISDDNRNTFKTQLVDIYKRKRNLLVSFEHGNNDKDYFSKGYKKIFDKCFVFGKKDVIHPDCMPGGIPVNDNLSKLLDEKKEHILVIVNFLGNRTSPFSVNFDKKLFQNIKLQYIQKYFNLPIVIKLKSRADESGFQSNRKYLQSILPEELDFKILMDVEDDNMLIAKSVCVISAPSTLAFKPIQLGIPTVILDKTGQIGSFFDYQGLVSHKSDLLPVLTSKQRHTEWIESSIEGGVDFKSTQSVVTKIEELL
jgi:hypothetical protein